MRNFSVGTVVAQMADALPTCIFWVNLTPFSLPEVAGDRASTGDRAPTAEP
jgi:hypothetical protein